MSAAKPKDHKDNKEKPEDERPWDQPQPPAQPFDPQKPETKPVPPPPKDEPPVKASDPPPDPLQAVDTLGNALTIGTQVLFFGVVSGFRIATDNRINVWVAPTWNLIVTNDPANPLQNLPDLKSIIVSGYNLYKSGTSTGDPLKDIIALDSTALDALRAAAQKAKDATPVELPSNFLAPSIL